MAKQKDYMTIDRMEESLRQFLSPFQLNKIRGAYEMAESAHFGHLMKDGSLFFYHLTRIARIIIEELKIYDHDLIIAALLHDLHKTNEQITSEIIDFNFGPYVRLLFDNFKEDLNILADRLQKAEINGIILFCQPAASLQIIRLLRQRKLNLPVFGPLSILNEDALSAQELHELDNILYVPSGTLSGSKSMTFRQEYQKTFGKMPGRIAAYAFDGMNALMDAIRTSGSPDREKIQQALLKINCEGVTGRILFDNMGNRRGSFVVSPFKP